MKDPESRRMEVALLGSLMLAATLVACTGGSSKGPTSTVPPVTTATATIPPVTVPQASIEGPITGGSGTPSLEASSFNLSAIGYQQSEFLLSGTATSYTSATPLTSDGKWTVTPTATAPYTTRMVVYRPISPDKFDGTVVVEWLNVSGGADDAAAWTSDHVQMARDGMVWVGISAQAAGIYGVQGSIAGLGGIKKADPARYSAVVHPGDSFSYSIFEQAGASIRHAAAQVLGGLTPKRVLALGESQSAFRLVTYIDALQPLSAGVYDGYFVYSEGRAGAALSQTPQVSVAAPTPSLIRTDLHVPVFIFVTEADLLTLGYLVARQPPTSLIREWEVAGTAHVDTYGLLAAFGDIGDGVADSKAFASMLNPPAKPFPGIIDCALPINAGSHTYELRAAMVAFNTWVATGRAPPQSPLLEVNSANPREFMLDPNGNALGGIRTPQVQAPVAKLSGVGQPAGAKNFCGLFGTTVPFSAATLAALYPTHAAFVSAWNAAITQDVNLGYLLPVDATVLDHVAAQSTVGG